jgi:hypothetical protein
MISEFRFYLLGSKRMKIIGEKITGLANELRQQLLKEMQIPSRIWH